MKPYIANWPIETAEAERFWSSNHKCNIMKALIAFCRDEADFQQIAKRSGYSLQWRNRGWAAFKQYVATPEMLDIPFTDIITPWWHCMPAIVKPESLQDIETSIGAGIHPTNNP